MDTNERMDCHSLLFSLFCMLKERIEPEPIQYQPKIKIWRTVILREACSSDDWYRCGNLSYYLILDLPTLGLILLSGRADGVCGSQYQADLIAIRADQEQASWNDRAIADSLRPKFDNGDSFIELAYFDQRGQPVEGILIDNRLIDCDNLIAEPGNGILSLAEFKPEAPERLYQATCEVLSEIS
jgi:hypothetical protein